MQFFLDTKVSPGQAVNWIPWLQGCHAHYMKEYGRAANEIKGIEVLPRAEHPGDIPEEPELASCQPKNVKLQWLSTKWL